MQLTEAMKFVFILQWISVISEEKAMKNFRARSRNIPP